MATTHDFKSRSLSPLQWTALRILTTKARNGKKYITEEELAQYKQTTMASFGKRKYLKKVGKKRYEITAEALRERSEFEAADVVRKSQSLEIAKYFRNGGSST
jgi:hypothetical protein